MALPCGEAFSGESSTGCGKRCCDHVMKLCVSSKLRFLNFEEELVSYVGRRG